MKIGFGTGLFVTETFFINMACLILPRKGNGFGATFILKTRCHTSLDIVKNYNFRINCFG